jgi:hypothetical protein
LRDCTIERVTELTPELRHFIATASLDLTERFKGIYDYRPVVAACEMETYMQRHFFWVARRDGKPVGALLARAYRNLWDPDKITLFQDLLYCQKSSGMAAYRLMKHFVTFGVENADLVFTMTTKRTNVKGRTLEKLGFVRTEDVYCMRGR